MADYISLGIDTIKEIFTFLTTRSNTKDNIKNNLLREVRDNMKLLEHRNVEGVNFVAILNGLTNLAIENAYAASFKFNKLTNKNTIPASIILNKRQHKYIGWDCEKLIYSIEGKIKDIKNIPTLYTDLKLAPINLTLRLDNLFYQLLLLVIFIRSEE